MGRPARAGQQVSATVSAADLHLRLVDTEAMPLYLQVVHQVKHLILTEELADGVLLPAVRPLAAHLGINPGTVVQAYRHLAAEGLIDAIRGRGSVVRALSGRSSDTMARERLLDTAIARLVARSKALGIPGDQALQRISAALLDRRGGVPVIFLGQAGDQAQRFVDALRRRYGRDEVIFTPFDIEQVRSGETAALRRELESAYTVLTFATLVPETERFLDQAGIEAEILGVRAELTPDTIADLEALSQRGRCIVITEGRAVSSVLAEVERVAGIDRHDITVVHLSAEGTPDDAELHQALASQDTVVFTSGVAGLVAELNLPPARLVELGFRLTEATLEELDRRWKLTEEDRG